MHKGGCELTAGGYCAAVVGMKDCMKELRFMNSGGATSEYGWGGCYVRVWCNNSFKESLPASMLPLFKQFKVTAAYGGGVPSPNTNDDYFALPAEKEVLGTNMNASETGEASLFQFDWYKTLANRVKQIGGSAIVYWLRSPSSHDGRKFCTVGTNGGYNNDYAHVQHGISPFGCI